eukprot:Em0002g1453a
MKFVLKEHGKIERNPYVKSIREAKRSKTNDAVIREPHGKRASWRGKDVIEQTKDLVPAAGEGEKDLTSKLCAALEKVLRLKKENDKLQLERAQHATAVQALQDKIGTLEEEKRCVQLEMHKSCLELVQRVEIVQAEIASVKSELLLKKHEVATLQMTLEQQKDEFRVREKKACITLKSEQASPVERRQRGTRDETGDKTSPYEDVDGTCTTILEPSGQDRRLKIELEKLQDECRAYREQSKQQKEQIDFYATAADEIVQENLRLKKLLRQEEIRVKELLTEVDGLRRDTTELSNAHQEERRKRSQLEMKVHDSRAASS